ncbi:MAG TPA: hypothetical protein VFX03_16930, partial [Thermomicrobiales bacterium]|nr:hypothetical protein [Thermomicrobiales bacterium]
MRPGVGSDANGGAFDPSIAGAGTDYSQQNAAQLSVADAVENGTTTITSATGGFSAAMIGNSLFDGTARFFITAVASANSITVDRATGTGSGLAVKVGGALATLDELYSARGLVGSNVAYLQSSAALTISTGAYSPPSGASDLGPTCLIGYHLARGDLDDSADFLNHPQLLANGSSVQLFSLATNYLHFRNLLLNASTGGPAALIAVNASSAGNYYFGNCRFTGAWTGRAVTMQGNFTLHRCLIDGCAGAASLDVLSGTDNYCLSSASVGGTSPGATVNGSLYVSDSLIAGNSGAA